MSKTGFGRFKPARNRGATNKREAQTDVCYGSLADIGGRISDVRLPPKLRVKGGLFKRLV